VVLRKGEIRVTKTKKEYPGSRKRKPTKRREEKRSVGEALGGKRYNMKITHNEYKDRPGRKKRRKGHH